MPVTRPVASGRHRYGIWLAVLIGLALRVAWVLYAHRPPAGLYDPARYASYADLIADGAGYVMFNTREATAYYPPGYPFFLGALEWIGRHTPLTDELWLLAGMVQAVLGAATVWMGAMLARRLLGPAAGVVAAFVLALYPNLVFHSAVLLSETFFNALFVGSLVVLLWRPWTEGLGAPRLVGSALLFGAAVMVRPVSVAVLGALAVAWWLHDHDGRLVVRRTAVFVGILAMFILPWTVRNLVRMDQVVLLSTNTGDNLCIGHRPGGDGKFAFDPACDTGESAATGAEAEVRHDRVITRRAIGFIVDDPLAELPMTRGRLVAMFQTDHDALRAVESYGADPFIDDDRFSFLRRVSDLYYLAVAAVGLVGMAVLADRRHPERLLIVLTTVAVLLVPLAFFGDPRFKVPAIPLVAVAVAAAFAKVKELVARRRPPEGNRPREAVPVS